MEDYETLTDSEKATSIRSKIKALQYQKYALELELISENAIPSPNENQINEFTSQIDKLNLRQEALESELDSLSV
jgi:hypothetical protein